MRLKPGGKVISGHHALGHARRAGMMALAPVLAVTALLVPAASVATAAPAAPAPAAASAVKVAALVSAVSSSRASVVFDDFPGQRAGLTAGRRVSSTVKHRTDHWLFGVSLPSFQAERNRVCAGDLPRCDSKSSHDGSAINWSSDQCTAPFPVKKYAQNPFNWQFHLACDRHDFGYRNYIGQRRCTNRPRGGTRQKIDQQFLSDLRLYICAKVKNRRGCNVLTQVYFQAVRKLGHC
jgi:hypothetical protein